MSYTITNIRTECFNKGYMKFDAHLYYDVKEKDGSVADVVRLFKNILLIGNIHLWNSIAQHSEAVDRTKIAKLNHLYLPLVTKKVTTAAKPIVAAPAKPAVPTLTPQHMAATIQVLDQQVKKLTADIVNLNKQLAEDRNGKEQLRLELVKTQAMLAKTQSENAVIKGALQILLNR